MYELYITYKYVCICTFDMYTLYSIWNTVLNSRAWNSVTVSFEQRKFTVHVNLAGRFAGLLASALREAVAVGRAV